MINSKELIDQHQKDKLETVLSDIECDLIKSAKNGDRVLSYKRNGFGEFREINEFERTVMESLRIFGYDVNIISVDSEFGFPTSRFLEVKW